MVPTSTEAGQTLCDSLPTGKSIPNFNPSTSLPPSSPPLKSGSTIPILSNSKSTDSISNDIHKAVDTNTCGGNTHC